MTQKQINEAKATIPSIWQRRENGIELTEEQKVLEKELSCRNMINSVLCYNHITVPEELSDNRYIREYFNEIGEDRVMELCKEQFDDFQKATVIENVHTDSKGVSYNSIVWADEKDPEELAIKRFGVNFSNTIDEKEEIITDDEKLNVILRLYDEMYEELINRTDLFAEQDISFKEALYDTDATFNMYADFYPDGNIKMTACMESDELGWTDAEVPLTKDEKKVLREDLDRVAKYQGTTVQKLFDEALSIERPDEPEKSNKKETIELD